MHTPESIAHPPRPNIHRQPTWTLLLCLNLVLFYAWIGKVVAAETSITSNSVQNAASSLNPTYGVGSWIWADKTYDQQTCRLWRSFDVPRSPAVKQARLHLTADNSYRLVLDGREAGRGGEWRGIGEYDLTWVLTPGRHVIAVEAFNDWSAGGMLAGLRIELADGQLIEVPSDEQWRIVPNDEAGWENKKRAPAHWPKAKIIAAFGSPPWQARQTMGMRVPPLRPLNLQFWQQGWFQIASLSVCAMALLLSLRLMAKLAIQSKSQQVLQRERARIARDIHDDLTARLTELVLLGEVAQSELPNGSPARDQFNSMSEKARGLLRAMNEIVWVVNSQRDTIRDFASYASKYAQTFLQSSSIRCRLDVEPDIPPIGLDLALRRNLFLAVKEALNNAVRHSQATELTLRIGYADSQIKVIVQDNGVGFDPAQADPERNGLTNMTQRIVEAGGACLITSKPAAGCCVEFTARVRQSPSRRPPLFAARSTSTSTERLPIAPPAQPFKTGMS